VPAELLEKLAADNAGDAVEIQAGHKLLSCKSLSFHKYRQQLHSFSATFALSAVPTGFVFISWVCCFCPILYEVARAKSGSLSPNRLPITAMQWYEIYSSSVADLSGQV
jgi:hypothetical protein